MTEKQGHEEGIVVVTHTGLMVRFAIVKDHHGFMPVTSVGSDTMRYIWI